MKNLDNLARYTLENLLTGERFSLIADSAELAIASFERACGHNLIALRAINPARCE